MWPISVIVVLACALVFLIVRDRMPTRARAVLGVLFLVIGIAEILSRSGAFFGLKGAAWIVVGLLYLVYLIPGADTMFRSRKTDV